MIEGKIGNTAQVGVHLYSSSNLYNWKDEGIVFKVNHDKGSEIEKGCIIERPKVVYNKLTNTFVMWFHLELINQGYDAARAGVAISNSPYGPFKYIKSIRSRTNCETTKGFVPKNSAPSCVISIMCMLPCYVLYC